MDCVVADHLQSAGLDCALSVFAAESGLDAAGGAALGRGDVLALLRLGERHPAAAAALERLQGRGGARGLVFAL
jgi:hypothetical protein